MALVESRGLLTPATFPGIEFPEALFVSYADFFFFFSARGSLTCRISRVKTMRFRVSAARIYKLRSHAALRVAARESGGFDLIKK